MNSHHIDKEPNYIVTSKEVSVVYEWSNICLATGERKRGRERERGGREGGRGTMKIHHHIYSRHISHGLSTFLPLFLRALRGYSTKKMNTEMGLWVRVKATAIR